MDAPNFQRLWCYLDAKGTRQWWRYNGVSNTFLDYVQTRHTYRIIRNGCPVCEHHCTPRSPDSGNNIPGEVWPSGRK